MSNRFGNLLCVTTFGESHGPAMGCIIDGCPPGLALSHADFAEDLARRRTGASRHTSQRRESDTPEILSGVYQGVTTGTPIAVLIRNTDARSRDYEAIADQFRPGHADFTYQAKYGTRDPRGGGRSSARETVMRVVAGAVAKKWLQQQHGIRFESFVCQIGPHVPAVVDPQAALVNALQWPDAAQVPELEQFLDSVRKAGDSVGGSVEVRVHGVPSGWGQPVYGKLDALLASALMSINAVKGVDIGDGFASAGQYGSEHRDAIATTGFQSNHSGGVLGGISTGQVIRCRAAFKPTSSLRIPVDSISAQGEPVQVVTTGRHDPCVALRAPIICEAMTALVLMDLALAHRAQCGDVLPFQFSEQS